MIEAIMSYMDILLKLFNIIVLLYAFYRFTRKPGEEISEKVIKLEGRVDELERSLDKSWIEHRAQKETNEAIQTSVLAIVDFELTFCSHADYEIDTSDLEEAKTILRRHLGKK